MHRRANYLILIEEPFKLCLGNNYEVPTNLIPREILHQRCKTVGNVVLPRGKVPSNTGEKRTEERTSANAC